jgi:hypothetical protein
MSVMLAAVLTAPAAMSVMLAAVLTAPAAMSALPTAVLTVPAAMPALPTAMLSAPAAMSALPAAVLTAPAAMPALPTALPPGMSRPAAVLIRIIRIREEIRRRENLLRAKRIRIVRQKNQSSFFDTTAYVALGTLDACLFDLGLSFPIFSMQANGCLIY